MGYILGQYNKNKTTGDDDQYMQLIELGYNDRKDSSSDSGVIGASEKPFSDECCRLGTPTSGSSFVPYQNYYFHCKIKRRTEAQTFYIQLIFMNDESMQETQYIKTINVAGGDIHEWADVEFMFSPLLAFDAILFELQRNVDDYRVEPRYPVIVYQELSQVLNLVSSIKADAEFIKIGVQSHPGLMMCINGEEIRTPRSGIYELKNGVIVVTFFSIISAAKENNNDPTSEDTVIGWMNYANAAYDAATTEEERAAIGSKCFFGTSKTRTIDSFTLDYIYKEED